MSAASSKRVQTLQGQFGSVDIVEPIGMGAIGTVFKARSSEDGKFYALKVVDKRSTSESHVVRFQREARIGSLLRHDNIVNVYESGEKDDFVFTVMTLIEGCDLAEFLEKNHPLTWKQVARFGANIAKALDHCHAQNVIHRDLKPANIFMSANSSLFLGDFGLALILGEGPHSEEDQKQGIQMIVGTPTYMAPEQFRRPNGVDARADLYSLGCILYELLAGQRPFIGSSLDELQELHERHKPSPLKKHRDDVPPLLNKLIRRLLSKRADWRYESASTIAHDLEGILDGSLKELSKDSLSAAAAPAKAESSEAIVAITSSESKSSRPMNDTVKTVIAFLVAAIIIFGLSFLGFSIIQSSGSLSYDQHITIGQEALKAKNWDKAKHHFTQAGYTFTTKEQKSKAEALFREALSKSEENQ